MSDKKIIWTGSIGSVVAAVCCFTPVLVMLLGAVGLSAWLSWIDYVLFPTLAISLGILVYGLYLRRQKRAAAAACCGIAPSQRGVKS